MPARKYTKATNNFELPFPKDIRRGTDLYTEGEFVKRVIDLTYLSVDNIIPLEEWEVRRIASGEGDLGDLLTAHLDKYPIRR